MNGVAVVDKPRGLTSHDVVARAKRIMGAKKAGHAGTLDPLATGVLVVCVGEATKLARFFSQETKEYEATMLLGVRTDTLDIDGTVESESSVSVGPDEVAAVIAGLTGKREQAPPRYSAVKYQGKSLYKWARKGVAIEPAPREVEVFSATLLEVAIPHVRFFVSCSKGTYIRSLCAEVGEALGCGACLCELRRTKSGQFTAEEAVPLEEVTSATLKPMGQCLPHFASVEVAEDLARKLREGYQPVADIMKMYHISSLARGDMIKFLSWEGSLITVAEMMCAGEELESLPGDRQVVRVLRVFNN
ncbi:MAG: tRNA pseudouridine(55) synthase TruB [Smithellaceae bacterium]|nr:tRNA pseudouridine(55) synthase TruB [Smithellaceae bacterium]